MDELMALNLEASGSTSESASTQQAADRPKFVSAFRVNGAPILPPLITTEKREELSSLRLKAMEVERRFRIWREMKANEAKIAQTRQQQGDTKHDENANDENCTTNENALVGDGNNNNIVVVDDKLNRTTSKEQIAAEPHADDDDNQPCAASFEETMTTPSPTTETWEGVFKPSGPVLRNSLNASGNTSGTPGQPITVRHCPAEVPTIRVNPPTPSTPPQTATTTTSSALGDISSNISIHIHELPYSSKSESTASSEDSSRTVAKSPRRKPAAMLSRLNRFEQTKPGASYSSCAHENLRAPRRSATVHSINSEAGAPEATTTTVLDAPAATTTIVRSNSFTVETPSKVLLEQMQRQQNSQRPTTAAAAVQPSSTRDTVESRAKRVQKVEVKSRSSSQSSRTRNAEPKPRSPYDSTNKTGAKPKLHLRKTNSTASTTVNAAAKKPTAEPPKASPTMSEENLRIFNQLQGEQRDRFIELQQRQQQEEQRLRMAFQAQRERLLSEIAASSSAASSSGSSASSSPPPPPPPPPIPPLPSDELLYGSSNEPRPDTTPIADTTGVSSGAIRRTPASERLANSSRRRLFPETAGQSNETNNNNEGRRSKHSSPTKARRPKLQPDKWHI